MGCASEVLLVALSVLAALPAQGAPGVDGQFTVSTPNAPPEALSRKQREVFEAYQAFARIERRAGRVEWAQCRRIAQTIVPEVEVHHCFGSVDAGGHDEVPARLIARIGSRFYFSRVQGGREDADSPQRTRFAAVQWMDLEGLAAVRAALDSMKPDFVERIRAAEKDHARDWSGPASARLATLAGAREGVLDVVRFLLQFRHETPVVTLLETRPQFEAARKELSPQGHGTAAAGHFEFKPTSIRSDARGTVVEGLASAGPCIVSYRLASAPGTLVLEQEELTCLPRTRG